MDITQYLVVNITTTPRQLRLWADKMEKEMPEKTLGDETTTTAIHKNGVLLKINADQESFYRHTHGEHGGFQSWL